MDKIRFPHTRRHGFWIGFVDFFTAGIFLLFYMPLGGLQSEIDEILGRRTMKYWKAYLLGIPGPYTSWWHMFGWNTFGLPLMGPAIATLRFFDTLNKVERSLNDKHAE